VKKLFKTRKYHYDMKSVKITDKGIKEYDLVVLSTDHTDFDYKLIASNAKVIIDTRNAFEKRGIKARNIFKA
jgi:UDP-N-acetyl-D-glucosamine dehydrogenase